MQTQTLTPTQNTAFGRLERIAAATPLVALTGEQGVGKTSLLEAYQRKQGGHLIRREDVVRAVSTVPPERSDVAIVAYFERQLARHDLVLWDDFSSLMENCHVGFPTMGYRQFYFARVLAPLLHKVVAAAGKRLILAGRPLAANGGSVPDPVDWLYGSTQVAIVDLSLPVMEDYASITANTLGARRAASIDFRRVYDFASKLNCYQLQLAARMLHEVEEPTAAQFIAGLGEHLLRANTRTEEVEALTFDTLPGSEEIAAKLETHVILPLENPELAARLELKPKRGVLLYGPPGTGKTSIGRALAHRMKGKFFLIDGSVIPDWPGSFFYKFKSIIDEAKANAPSVVFIDDADVLFTIPHIAGLPRYLLTLLDGMESETAGKVCVMMTAMDASKLPEALLRSGRVELWLDTRLPDARVRAGILQRWMADVLPEADGVDYAALAAETAGRTPADLRRLVSDAKSLYAADRVRGRAPAAATEYLRHAIEQNLATRARMDEHLVPASEGVVRASVDAVTEHDFDAEVLQSKLPVLVDFWAPWCGPCKSIAPILEELAPVYAGRLRIVKLDCDENPELVRRYQIRSIPRMALFVDGEIVADLNGLVQKSQLEEMIDTVLGTDEPTAPRKARYGLGVGGMAETGVGCKMSGW